MRRKTIVLAGSGLIALAAALWLRYSLVEQEGMGIICAQAMEGRCAFRQFVIGIFTHNRLGYFSLGAALLALLPRLSPLAWGGWVGGIMSLVLYCFDAGAPAALLALLLLARPATANSRLSTSQA